MKNTGWRVGIGAALLSCCCAIAAAQQTPAKEPAHSGLPLSPDELAPPIEQSGEAQLHDELRRNPGSADLYYRLALLERLQNKPKDSLQTYTQAASLRKPNADELRSVALDYVLLGDFEDAIHWLNVALAMDSSNVDVLYSLGRCLYTQNRFAEADAAFTRVLQIAPRHLKAEENLGLTYDAENQPEKAEQALRKAVAWSQEDSAQSPWPFLDLGVFLLDQSRAQEALPFLQKAVALDRGSAVCHEKLGRALAATGNPNAGAQELEVAVKLDPNNPKTHFELGRAYRESGETEKARAEFAASKLLYGAHNQN
jgi:tetratricopeptide (TPR) repeat protein